VSDESGSASPVIASGQAPGTFLIHDAELSAGRLITPIVRALTEQPPEVASEPSRPTRPTSPGTRRSDGSGSTPGKSASAGGSRASRSSGAQSRPSSAHWSQPGTVKQFAGQVNKIATMVLNGEIDLDHARVYAGLARTVAQSISLEVTRARFLQTVPDLQLEYDEEPE
jgi:hypothetical protein